MVVDIVDEPVCEVKLFRCVLVRLRHCHFVRFHFSCFHNPKCILIYKKPNYNLKLIQSVYCCFNTTKLFITFRSTMLLRCKCRDFLVQSFALECGFVLSPHVSDVVRSVLRTVGELGHESCLLPVHQCRLAVCVCLQLRTRHHRTVVEHTERARPLVEG